MAKIKNVQLKAVKMFEAREGYGFNANIYFNNKFVGRAFDAGNGGCMDIDLLKADAKQNIISAAREYFAQNPKYMYSSDDTNYLEEIIEELLYLNELEKTYKSGVKQGYPITVTLLYNERTSEPYSEGYRLEEEKTLNMRNWNEDIEMEMRIKYGNPSVINIYRDINDFIIE